MNTTSSTPFIRSGSPAVLLCFLPSATTPNALVERALMTELAYQLQERLPVTIRVLKVDESLHPDIVKSFNLTQLPAFILVEQGIERWRQEGVVMMEEQVSLPSLLQKINGI